QARRRTPRKSGLRYRIRQSDAPPHPPPNPPVARDSLHCPGPPSACSEPREEAWTQPSASFTYAPPCGDWYPDPTDAASLQGPLHHLVRRLFHWLDLPARGPAHGHRIRPFSPPPVRFPKPQRFSLFVASLGCGPGLRYEPPRSSPRRPQRLPVHGRRNLLCDLCGTSPRRLAPCSW